MPKFCDSCLDAAYDDSVGILGDAADGPTLSLLLFEFGEDIPDHICERIETSGEIACDCPAHALMPSLDFERGI